MYQYSEFEGSKGLESACAIETIWTSSAKGNGIEYLDMTFNTT